MTLKISTGLRNRILGINTDLSTNGDFTSDATGWTGSTATLASVSGGQSGNCLEVTGSGGAGYAANTSAITVVVGRIYKVTVYFKKGTGTNGGIKVGTSADDSTYYDSGNITDADWTAYTTYFAASSTDLYVTLEVDSDTLTHLYDSIDVVELGRSIQDVFSGGNIKIYTGTQPTSADDAPTGTLLVTINNGGSGITFSDAASGVNSIGSGETWSGTCVATGTAGWARLMRADDGGASSTTDSRLDMSVATSGAQINFSSTSFASGATQTITSFAITMPAS